MGLGIGVSWRGLWSGVGKAARVKGATCQGLSLALDSLVPLALDPTLAGGRPLSSPRYLPTQPGGIGLGPGVLSTGVRRGVGCGGVLRSNQPYIAHI